MGRTFLFDFSWYTIFMDKESQKILDGIVKKNPSDLSYEEIQFLNARRTYLTNEQKRVFVSVLVKEKV
jgi:hypothetical protein